MPNRTKLILYSLAAMTSAQAVALLFNATIAQSTDCLYHPGAINAYVEKLGERLNHRIQGYPVGTDMPPDRDDDSSALPAGHAGPVSGVEANQVSPALVTATPAPPIGNQPMAYGQPASKEAIADYDAARRGQGDDYFVGGTN